MYSVLILPFSVSPANLSVFTSALFTVNPYSSNFCINPQKLAADSGGIRLKRKALRTGLKSSLVFGHFELRFNCSSEY